MARRSSTVSGLRGRETPRLFTPPARKLTRRTTLGYEAIRFAEDVLGVKLLPWQRWWMLHALELDDNGDGFRFRTILTLVARQNGKTHLLKILALWFMYLGHGRLVLGAAQSLDIARESWQGAVDMAQDDPELADEIANVRQVNGEQELRLDNGARYRIAAANRRAGRGLSVDLLILDELREHRDWAAWAALSKTTIARPNALVVGISNAGDDESVVLNGLRDTARNETDPTLALFEWSAPDGCELDDRDAWAQANPGLGHTISPKAIASAMAQDSPAVFRTEVLCQRVDSLDSAVDGSAWRNGRDASGSLDDVKDRVVLGLDVAPDGAHVALVAAAPIDDGERFRLEVVEAWDSTEQAREDLADLLARVKPRALVWFPGGPAAALAPIIRPPSSTTPAVMNPTAQRVARLIEGRSARAAFEVIELTGGKVAEACMSFADLVKARRIVHPGDALLDAHVGGAAKLTSGDGWRFSRRGGIGYVSAAYAAAGAVHGAATMPAEIKLPRSRVF